MCSLTHNDSLFSLVFFFPLHVDDIPAAFERIYDGYTVAFAFIQMCIIVDIMHSGT